MATQPRDIHHLYTLGKVSIRFREHPTQLRRWIQEGVLPVEYTFKYRDTYTGEKREDYFLSPELVLEIEERFKKKPHMDPEKKAYWIKRIARKMGLLK